MTDQNRLKDLMTRMVSMSPQPPDFPEEMQMAKPSVEKGRNPVVIFAVAAAAVLVLAIPLVLWQGAEPPQVGGGTTTPPVPTTQPGPGTIEPGTATTVPTAVISVGWPVYLIQDPGNSSTGNPALVAMWLRIEDEDGLGDDILERTESAVAMLLNYQALGGVLPEGFANPVPAGIEANVGSAGSQLITLDLNQRFLDGAGGLLADITMLNQLVYTATQATPGAKVLFTVDGEPIEAYGTEGLSLLDPVGREDFLTEVNPIIITEPVTVSDGEIRVVGRANVYEAVISYRVTGTDVEGFAMATCGTGCWGDFDFTLSADDLFAESSIEVFVSSAEDGSPTFVISIPLSAVVEAVVAQP